uniref:Titin-like n=1 Tax=Diabrotica virgifera virgifera TaxID=50390 RepID=A0A6P7G5K7_DIAVI
MARGMAQQYEENLDEKPNYDINLAPVPRLPKAEQAKPVPHKDQVQLRKTDKGQEFIQHEVDIDSKQGAYPPDPTETGVHGREIHVTKQKQVQKEQKGDLEITRNITATETTDVEHKAKTTERVVQGQVLPSNPPVFTKKIKPVRAFENDSAKFEVEFDGDPLPKITWFREDFPITSSPDLKVYTFSTKSILQMRQVFMEDSGVFSVVAENRGGTAKCSANLVVQERRRHGTRGAVPPSFTATIQSTKANVGQLVRFDAKIDGTKPIDVYWLKNGKKIVSDIRYKTLEEDEIYTLLIIEVVPEDTGKYECVAINNSGEARCEAECVVTSPSAAQKPAKPTTPGAEKAPALLEPLKDQTIKEGQAVVFRCKISAKPTPVIKWQKADKVIKPSKYFQMTKEGDFCTLKISEAFPEDEGVYKCVAENPAGAVSTQAKLKVIAPETQEVAPSLTPMKDVTVPEGSPAQFKTTISGKPKPTIQWLREGFLIPESPDFQMIQEGNNAILLISSTYEEDTGLFTCRATSSAGQVEQSAKLTVKRRVGTYRKSAKTDVTDRDDQQIITKDGYTTGGPGVTHQQATLGSKGGPQQPLDANELPVGDESLPWRQKGIRKTYRKDSTSLQKILVEQKTQAQPWTEEQIVLKKTKIERKEIQREKLEDVTLKPLLQPFTETDDTSLLSLSEIEREKISQQEALVKKDWRKERRPEQHLQQHLETEDSTTLSLSEHEKVQADQTLTQRDWRRQKQTLERKVHEEDSTLLKLDERTTETSQQDTAIKDWRKRRDRGDEKIKEDLKEETQTLETEEKVPQEPVPWNQQEITLKKTPRQRKEVQKETLEEVTLKPFRKSSATSQTVEETTTVTTQRKPDKVHTEESSLLKLTAAESIEETKKQETKGWRKPREEIKPVEKQLVTEDATILRIDENQNVVEVQQAESRGWRKPKEAKPSEQSEEEKPKVDEQKPEPVPWNKEQITLKKTQIARKEQTKETLEQVGLKPTRKTVPEEHVEDKQILTLKDNVEEKQVKQPETQQWRKPKQLEEKPIIEDKDVLTAKEETMPEQQVPGEELIPWNKQKIELKKTRREVKHIQEDKIEEVQLKPTRKIHTEEEEIITEEIQDQDGKQKIIKKSVIKDQKHIEKDETKTIESLKPDEEVTESSEVTQVISETKSWRQPRKQKPEETEDQPEKPIYKVREEEIILQEAEEEIVPWKNRAIVLKKTKIERKEQKKDEVEKVELKPFKKQHIEDEEFISVDQEKEQTRPVEEQKEEIVETQVVETKGWRRQRQPLKPEIKDEKPEAEGVEDKPSQVYQATEEDVIPQKPKEEMIPWNKQEIVLKRTKVERKEQVKEDIEKVELKPFKKQHTEEETLIEDITDKDQEETETIKQKEAIRKVRKERKHKEEHIEKEEQEKPEQIAKEETIKTDTAKIEEVPETKSWRKPKPLKPETTEEKPETSPQEIYEAKEEETVIQKPKEEIIPWNKQEITLKRTKVSKKEQVKEEIEQVELKPHKKHVEEESIIKDTPEKAEENIEIITQKQVIKKVKKDKKVEERDVKIEEEEKPQYVAKEIDVKPEDSTIEKVEEVKQTDTRSWRKPKKPIQPEVEEQKPESGTTEQPKEVYEVTEEETVFEKSKEEVIPWNKQQITLKRTKKEKKEQVKDEIETVELKPHKKQHVEEETIIKDVTEHKEEVVDVTTGKKVIKKVKKDKKFEEKDIKIEEEEKPQYLAKEVDVKPEDSTTETVEEVKQTDTRSWRKPKKPIQPEVEEQKPESGTTEQPKEVYEVTEEETVFEKSKEEVIPWNKQQITLKRTKKEKKEQVKDEIETVELKPHKKQHVEEETIIKDIIEDKDEDVKVTTDKKVIKKVKKDKTFEEKDVKIEEEEKPQYVAKEVDVKPEDSTTETVEEVKQTDTRSWRKPKKPIQPEVEEQKPESGTTEQPKEVYEVTEEETVFEKSKEEVIPWNKQQITLKRTKKEKKEQVKDEIETVELKPHKKQHVEEETIIKDIIEDKDEDVKVTTDKKVIKKVKKDKKFEEKDIKIEEEEKTQYVAKELDVKPEDSTFEKVEEVKQPDTKSWRKPKKPVQPEIEEQKPESGTTEQPKEVYEVTEEETVFEKPKEEVIPWNKQQITLKRTKKEKKEQVKDELETVELKAIKKPEEEEVVKEEAVILETPEQEIESEKEKGVKKVKKEKKAKDKRDETKEIEKPTEIAEEVTHKPEEATVVEIPESKETETKPWRKSKKTETHEEVAPVKPEISETKPSEIYQVKEEESLLKETQEEIIPWNKEAIKLKRTKVDRKEAVKDELEKVELKPLKKKPVEEIIKSSSSEEEKEEELEQQVDQKIRKTKEKRRRKPKAEKPKAETVEVPEKEETQPEEIKPEEIKSPESIIIETVTEVEDTVVLKVDDKEKPKPKTPKKFQKEEITPEEVKLKPVQRREIPEQKEVSEMDQISLKPIPHQEIHVEEKREKKVKPKKPVKYEDMPEIEEGEKYVPEVAEKIEFEEKPKEVTETQPTPWRRQEKPKKEEIEEEKITLKIGKGKIPKEEEIKEEVTLKPIKKTPKETEDISEVSQPKQIPKSDIQPKEYEKIDFDVTPKVTEEKPQIVDMTPVTISEEIREAEPVPEEPKAPWRRTPKEKPVETVETKEMPKGKRKPLPEEEKEEIKLKPISKEKPEVPEYKTEVEEVKRESAEVIEIKEYDDQIKIQPIDKKTKKDKKTRPKPKEEDKPEFTADEETKDFQTTTVEEILEEKIQELVPEKAKEEVIEVPEETKVVSETEITLVEKKAPVKPKEVEEKQPTEEAEQVTYQKDMTVQITSKKVKKDKQKTVSFDDSQPIPELEIISQKRITEIIDKVPEETVRDDVEVQEKTVQKTVTQKTIEKRVKKKTIAPRFIQRVEPVVAEEGKPATIICKVDGSPFPDITWYKNEKVFQATERAYVNIVENTVTLEFAKVEPQDVAIYSCKATNSAGAATSTANLVILEKEETGEAPHFVKPLQPQIIEETEVAKLECVVTGQPTPKVSWFKEGKPVKPSPEQKISFNPETGVSTLEILKPTPLDEKVYSVKAENKFGKAECRANLVISKSVVVSQPVVMYAPKITKPVQAVLAKPDEEIVLEASFEGTPTPEITWLRNGTEIKPTKDYIIETKENTTKLTIKKNLNKKQKGGKYEVRAKNPRGEARSSGSVQVVEQPYDAQPPRFVELIKPQKATLGDIIILEATVEAIPEATFQWFHETLPLETLETSRIVTKGNKSVLLISQVTPELAGSITCRAENVAGSVTCTASIRIIEETEYEETNELEYPRFVKRLSPVRVMDGEKVEFSCVVIGKPVPKVEWFHNNIPVKEAKDVVIYQDTEGLCTLAITEVFPENAGEYTCVAANRIGEAICKSSLIVEAYEYVPDSELGHMTGSEEDLLADKTISETDYFPSDSDVECAPKIIKKLPQVLTVKDGEVTKFEVQAVGKPKPEGKWLKHGEEIIPSHEFMIENFDDGTSILTISEVYPDDTGDIVYEATNPLGVAVTSSQLLVESVEGIVGTKEYRKPEWVTHMEELSAALKAAQSPPTFIHEITNIFTTEAETIKFEAFVSGTPQPGK